MNAKMTEMVWCRSISKLTLEHVHTQISGIYMQV